MTGDTPHAHPSFRDAAVFWTRLGFISFGGPAGQIAVLHREVVEQRRWVDERQFAGALNFCMLLPGPEALQLAIYLGWRLHGLRGGLAAGLGFIVPAIVLLFVLSYLYARFGHLPAAHGVLLGLKAAVVALVVQALVRIGRRALDRPRHVVIALAAFVALEWLRMPFPFVVLAAGAVGLAAAWRAPRSTGPVAGADGRHGTVRVAVTGLALWLVPLAIVVLTLGSQSLWTKLYLFFTEAALVTFGGAYAVLGYVVQHLVRDLGWLTAQQAASGLALAETTPGPLVIVLQFMGFMAGWNNPAPLSPAGGAMLASALASWATFLPSFVFIFLGAPYVERLTHDARISSALAAITAAVVGIIATLALLLARAVLLTQGPGPAISWPAILIAAAAWLALLDRRVGLHWVLVLAAIAGLVVHALGWA